MIWVGLTQPGEPLKEGAFSVAEEGVRENQIEGRIQRTVLALKMEEPRARPETSLLRCRVTHPPPNSANNWTSLEAASSLDPPCKSPAWPTPPFQPCETPGRAPTQAHPHIYLKYHRLMDVSGLKQLVCGNVLHSNRKWIQPLSACLMMGAERASRRAGCAEQTIP